MKKLLLSAAFIVLGLASFGKKRAPVVVEDYQIKRVGQSVNATLTLIHPRDGRNSYRTIAEPMLVSGARSVAMPLVVFRTAKGRILDFRHRATYPPTATMARNRDMVVYTYQFPYKAWMNESQLLVGVRSNGCGTLQEEPSVWVSPNVSLPPDTLYRVKPSYAYQKALVVALVKSEAGSAFLEFPVGSAQLLGNFKNNAAELEKINRSLESVRSDPDHKTLQGVTLWGTCSPEGSYAVNTQLAQNRTQAVRDYLTKSAPIAASQISIGSTPENWAGLVAALADDPTPWARQVTAIALSDVSDDQKDRRVRALNSGATYGYMLAEIYPKLRRVDYRVDYLVRELAVEGADLVNAATDALRAGRVGDVLPLLDQVTEQNAYYYNTLGLYRLLQGDDAAARTALGLSAAMGLPEAEANLRQLAMRLRSLAVVASQQ